MNTCKISKCIAFVLLISEREIKQENVVAMVSCENPQNTEIVVLFIKFQHFFIASHKPPNSTVIFETFS